MRKQVEILPHPRQARQCPDEDLQGDREGGSEPWAPYDGWRAPGRRDQGGNGRSSLIHSELLFLKLPVLFFNPWLKRRTEWADDLDPAERLATPVSAAA